MPCHTVRAKQPVTASAFLMIAEQMLSRSNEQQEFFWNTMILMPVGGRICCCLFC